MNIFSKCKRTYHLNIRANQLIISERHFSKKVKKVKNVTIFLANLNNLIIRLLTDLILKLQCAYAEYIEFRYPNNGNYHKLFVEVMVHRNPLWATHCGT